jgi:NurA-like 5'-3' nuclease
MRNKVVEISMNDIEQLITDFVSEDQRWSQSVREEVKYGDMNPESDRDYIIDELWIKNTAGTVVTMPYGDMITFNSSRHFFRGENQIYPSSIPL